VGRIRLALIRPLIRKYTNSQSPAAFESSIGLVPPLNLCCLAAAAEEAGFEVAIHDCEAHQNSEKDLEEFLMSYRPDVVGISIITTNFHGALDTARIARRLVPQAKILCGGTHMMIFPEETLSYPEFDYGFIGEAERPLVQFLQSLENNTPDRAAIPGLVWREGEKVLMNRNYGFNEDLDALPFPAYHLLDLSKYQMPNAEGTVISLFLSRGCPFDCGFCYRNPQLRRLRFKSTKRAVEEIEHMIRNYSVTSINFVDEAITIQKDRFLDFCLKLKERKWDLEWQSPTRVSSIDEEIVIAAREAGCHAFRFGIESGNDKVLARINKAVTCEMSERALKLCRRHGIKTVGYFIIGYLGEDASTINQTIEFACRAHPDYAAFFPAIPMPRTRLCEECEAQGLIPKDYWRDFVLGKREDPLPFLFPNAGDLVAQAYRRFYFAPGHILSQMRTREFYRNFSKKLTFAFRLLFMRFKRGDASPEKVAP